MTLYTILSVQSAVLRDSEINEATAGVMAYFIKYRLCDKLDATVDLWIESKKPVDAQINGLSIFDLMQKKQCDYPTALVLLSIYADDCENAGTLIFNKYDYIRI